MFFLKNIGLHIGLQASPQPMYRKGVFWPGRGWQGHTGTKQGQARARQPGCSRLGLSIGEKQIFSATTIDSEADGPANLNAHLAESHTRILRHVAPAESRCASCRVLEQEARLRGFRFECGARAASHSPYPTEECDFSNSGNDAKTYSATLVSPVS